MMVWRMQQVFSLCLVSIRTVLENSAAFMSWLGHPEHPRPLGGSRCPLMKGQVTWFEPKATQTAQALPTDFQLSGTSERTGLSGEAKG